MFPQYASLPSSNCVSIKDMVNWHCRYNAYREPQLGVKIMDGLASLIAGRLDSTRLQLLDMWE